MRPRALNPAEAGARLAAPWSPVIAGELNRSHLKSGAEPGTTRHIGDEITDETKTVLERL